MWIFTKYGFFSVVCARKDGGASSDVDTNTVMIRARNIKHLQQLCERFDILQGSEIIENTGTDYPCRLIVRAKLWRVVLDQLARDIDYGNFKGCVDDLEYLTRLHYVWSEMRDYQARIESDVNRATC